MPPRATPAHLAQVDGHPRCADAYRQKIIDEMASYGNGFDKLVDVQQPRPTTLFERRSLLGVHAQPQPGLNRVGIHVPVGRLSVTEARQIADLAVSRYLPLLCRYSLRT